MGRSEASRKRTLALDDDGVLRTLILGEEIFLPGGKLIADTEVRIASKGRGGVQDHRVERKPH